MDCLATSVTLLVNLEENKVCSFIQYAFFYVQVLGAGDVAVNKTSIRKNFKF